MKNRTSFVTGQGNLPALKIETQWSTAEIYLHGAHVTHFQRQGEPPLLWMSGKSKFDDKSAIRGGIPIIFPWFGAKDGSPAHGFARVKSWELLEVASAENGAVSVRLRLPECAEAAGYAPFNVEYVVTVGETLGLELTVTNKSTGQELVFEECLHSYFTVGDISAVSVAGLKGLKYVDKVGGSVERMETNDVITVSSEVDRVYQDTTSTVEIRDAKLGRKILVEKEGSAATVVWNPWIAKSKAMADFGDEEYHGMICVESGNVGKNKLTLAPGKTFVMKVKLSSAAA